MYDAENTDSALIQDLKRRAAQIPAEHVRVFFEFLAHQAEPLGLTPDQRAGGGRLALAEMFATFIPEHKAQDIYSEELFDSAIDQIGLWNDDANDGDRDAAEVMLDNDLRVLVPPRRQTADVRKSIELGTGVVWVADVRIAS